ncbi:MAG: PucR family transcriptional regulator [Steroidobacteraceae bacterium]
MEEHPDHRLGDADIGVPQLSDGLNEVVLALRDDVDAVVERVVAAMQAVIGEYANLSAASTDQDVSQSVRFHVREWFDTLLSGAPLSSASLERIAAMGSRRVHQGITLAGLLRAFRIGSREIWKSMLNAVHDDSSLSDELLFRISPYFLYHFDVVAQTISAAYQTEQHLRMRWRDRLRYELCTIIFSHPENAQGFNDHAQALGMDLSAEHAALALRLSAPLAQSTELRELPDPFLFIVARLLGSNPDSLLYTLRHGDMLVWSALPRGGALLANELKLVASAKALGDAEPKIAAIGIGLPARKHQGWRVSAEQALRALDLGLRLNPNSRVHRYTDIILDDAVLSSEDTVWFFDAIARELATEVGLLETLSVYLELAMHRKATAGRLEIHTNTLDYRLNRIETILGAPLVDPGVLAKLHTALHLRRISNVATRPDAG